MANKKSEKCVDHFNRVTKEIEGQSSPLTDTKAVYLELIAGYLAVIADALTERKDGDTDA